MQPNNQYQEYMRKMWDNRSHLSKQQLQVYYTTEKSTIDDPFKKTQTHYTLAQGLASSGDNELFDKYIQLYAESYGDSDKEKRDLEFRGFLSQAHGNKRSVIDTIYENKNVIMLFSILRRVPINYHKGLATADIAALLIEHICSLTIREMIDVYNATLNDRQSPMNHYAYWNTKLTDAAKEFMESSAAKVSQYGYFASRDELPVKPDKTNVDNEKIGGYVI